MHHELPAHLDLEHYRKTAKALVRAHRGGEPDAVTRAAEALGPRAAHRFQLSDAQHVIASEHGYRSWGDFKRWIETREPEPPVGRIGREPVAAYEARARKLIAEAARGNRDALRRVQAHVPRLAGFTGRELDLRDAKLVVAREYGFPTWRELTAAVERAIDSHVDRPGGSLGRAFELIERGDVAGLRRLLDEEPGLVRERYPGAATTILEAIAQPDMFGRDLGMELGVDREIVELLIERGSELVGPLGLAACFNRVELVRMLLAAGADVGPGEIWGLTPLQTAIYHGSQEAGDLLAQVGVVPDALYVAAGAGRTDELEKWFDSQGTLRPEALELRPNLADVGWPPAPPPHDEPQEVLGEALALAAYNGRLEAMRRLVEHGARVDGRAHGITGLHFATIRGRLDTIRWLLEHGADPQLHDAVHNSTPLEWAEKIGAQRTAAYLRREPERARLRQALQLAQAGWGDEGEVTLDTDAEYAPGDPVRVGVVKRGRRYDIDDQGAAVAKAGNPTGWLSVAERLVAAEGMNVNRRGVIFVPSVEGRDLATLALRLGDLSLAVHQELLELP